MSPGTQTAVVLPAPPYPADVRAKGWRFELDLERIEQSDTWALAPADLRPWLLMLWVTAWKQVPCGSLADDDQLIAARIGMKPAQFAKARSILMRGWWKAEDGRLYHDTVTDRVLDMLGVKEKERARKAEYRKRREVEEGATGQNRDNHGRDHGNDMGVPDLSRGTDLGHDGDGHGSDPGRDDTGTGTGTGTGINKYPPTPQRGGGRVGPAAEPEGFGEFWAAYPRKVGKDAARKAFAKRKPDAELLAKMLAAVAVQAKSAQWQRDGGQYIPHPSTWLNEGRWDDGEGAAQGDSESRPRWALQAGFENRWEAENERCYAHNAHLFRDGRRMEVPE